MRTAEAIYMNLESQREVYLQRARECAKLTLPMVMPEKGANYSTEFDTPYQGLGARGVNNLASALLMSLLPPNQPMFRLVPSLRWTRSRPRSTPPCRRSNGR
jgi:hypothetical protein